MRQWVGKQTAPTVAEPVVWSPRPAGGDVGAEQALRVTYGPASWIGEWHSAALEGIAGGTKNGCWHTVGTTHYLYFTHNDGAEQVGPDPGLHESALSGLTGVEVPLAAGNHTAAAVASATQTAWAGAGGITATLDGEDVRYTGDFDAGSSSTGGTWAARHASTGLLGSQEMASTSSFGVDTTRWQQIDPSFYSFLPPFRIVGARALRGNILTSDVRLAVSVGGATNDPETADIIGQKVATNGHRGVDDWATVFFAPGDTHYVADPSTSPPIFVGIQGDGANSSISAENNAGARAGFSVSGTTVLWITGENTGVGTPMSSPVGAITGTSAFSIFMGLIIQVEPYYGNGQWRSYFGAEPGRNDTGHSNFSNVNEIFVSWLTELPAIAGNSLLQMGMQFGAHDASQQIGLEWWGATSNEVNSDGMTLQHHLETTGSGTGRQMFDVSPSLDISAGGYYRMSVKGDPGVADPTLTTLAFPVGANPTFDTPTMWSWAGTTSRNFADGEVEHQATGGETNITFASGTPTESPLNPSTEPVLPGNSGSLNALIGHDGIVLQVE